MLETQTLQVKTLEEKVGQMLLVGFQGLEPPDYILEWLRTGQIGGVILFARNVASPEQLIRLTGAVHAAAKYPALIAIDQEGGTVARLRQGFTESPGAMALSAAHDGEALTREVSQMLAEEMFALGINWTYAPAVDISYNAANPTVGTRSFGTDKEQVSQMAAAAVQGFQAGGIAACAKHFPGLGNTSMDTHLELPSIDVPVEQILFSDLMPYHTAIEAGLSSVMTTHTIFTSLDTRYPATLSSVIVPQLLRQKLGFDGVVTTDCMEMKSISNHYSPGESAVLAAQAGIDIILFSHTRPAQQAAYDGLLAAAQSGELSLELIDAANARIARFKARFAARQPDLDVIRSPAHLEIAQKAARAGIVLLKNSPGFIPVSAEGTALIEFSSYLDSGAVESGGLTGLSKVLRERLGDLPSIALDPVSNPVEQIEKAGKIAGECRVLLLATRNAHLIPEELLLAREFTQQASWTILICLRNPYDAGVIDADVVFCTCGDSAPSLQAVVDALAGDFIPSGRLPVEIF